MSLLATGILFLCTPLSLWDGDGPIHCTEGPRVRLAGIAAREIDESCLPAHPCPKASGVEARDYLASLLGTVKARTSDGHLAIRGPALQCRSTGTDIYGRTVAWCASPKHGDLSCKMVESNMAAKWNLYWRDHACQSKN